MLFVPLNVEMSYFLYVILNTMLLSGTRLLVLKLLNRQANNSNVLMQQKTFCALYRIYFLSTNLLPQTINVQKEVCLSVTTGLFLRQNDKVSTLIAVLAGGTFYRCNQ